MVSSSRMATSVPGGHLRGVGDGGAQAAAGSAAVLELPELMGDAEFQSRRIRARSVAGIDFRRRLGVAAVDGDRDLFHFRHRLRDGREHLLLLVPQHPHDVPETDDRLDRRRRGFAFAATIDTRRARRVVGGELAKQFDLTGAPERRRDAHSTRRIAQRLDFGVDRFQERRRIEVERVSQRTGRDALQSFGAVQIDDEMMAVRTDAARLLHQRRHLVPVRNPPAQPERVLRGELAAMQQFEQQDMEYSFCSVVAMPSGSGLLAAGIG